MQQEQQQYIDNLRKTTLNEIHENMDNPITDFDQQLTNLSMIRQQEDIEDLPEQIQLVNKFNNTQFNMLYDKTAKMSNGIIDYPTEPISYDNSIFGDVYEQMSLDTVYTQPSFHQVEYTNEPINFDNLIEKRKIETNELHKLDKSKYIIPTSSVLNPSQSYHKPI